MSKIRKNVLITGCSPGGIGNALAREFHSRGFRVLATARKAETISDLSDLGIDTLSLEVDEPESVERCKEDTLKLTGGGLDYLVNNAGRSYTMPALDINFEEVQATFNTNLFAVMRMCQTFAPLLIGSKGTIVQIGSVAGVIPYVFGSVYNASKAALHSYSDTLRVELEPFDVKVMVIVTGGVKSRIARTKRVLPEGSFYEPIEARYLRRQKHSQEVGMPTATYAKDVVNKVLGSEGWLYRSKMVWAGNMANLVWWLDSFLWKGLQGWTMGKMFQVGELRNIREGKKNM